MADRDSSDMIAKFDGSGSVDFWLSLLEAVQVANEWEDGEMVKRASLLLRGEAKTWFEHGRLWEKNLTWDQFKPLIKQRFSRKTPRHVVTASIGRLKLKQREDIRDFAARMSALANTSEPAIDTSDMCGMLLKALPPHYRTVRVEAVDGEDDFEALVNECRRIQLLDADADAEQPRNEDHKSAPKDQKTNSGKAKQFTGTCNYCHIKGHKERDCRKKKRDLGEADHQGQGPRYQMETRESTRQARFDPKTHQRIKSGDIHCLFCDADDHIRDDCYLWKRMIALVSDSAVKPTVSAGSPAASTSGPAKN